MVVGRHFIVQQLQNFFCKKRDRGKEREPERQGSDREEKDIERTNKEV